MNRMKQVFIVFLVMVMTLTVLPGKQMSQVEAASAGTVTMSIEKFSLGQGYLIEPVEVSFQQGENVAQVFDRLMKQRGYTYSNDCRLTSGLYLRSIDRADTGKLNIPSCIQNMPGSRNWDGSKVNPPNNKVNTGNVEFPTLGEFAYSNQSGWYYFVNNVAPTVGFSETKVKNGDVIRIQFTVYGLGADLGAGYGVDPMALNIPNRDVITKKMAVMNQNPGCFSNATWKKAYQKAVAVVSDLNSTYTQISSASNSLPSSSRISSWQKEEKNKKKYTPKKTTLKSLKKSGSKKMKLTWKKVSGCTGYQIYMSTKKSSGYKRIKTITKNKTVTYTKTKLKKGKTYYFKVRTYRKAGKKTYYANYSNVKGLKMK